MNEESFELAHDLLVQEMEKVVLTPEEVEKRIHILSYRNPPQIEVIKMLAGNNPDRATVCAKIISKCIDNVDNLKLRELIANKKVEEAAEVLISVVQDHEDWKNLLREAA